MTLGNFAKRSYFSLKQLDGNQVTQTVGPITRARVKGLQNLVSRVLLRDLDTNEARWVNSFILHDYNTFNGLCLSIQQEAPATGETGPKMVHFGSLT